MIRKKSFAIICSLCLVVAMLVPNLGFAEEGDGSGGTTTTTSTFKMIVHYANGATGTVQYKDDNDSTWQTAPLTLQNDSIDTYEATLTDVPTGRFSIRAIPGENCEMDTERNVTLTYNNSTWGYEATSISTENGTTFDLGWPEYEIEFGFDKPGGSNPGGGDQPAQTAPTAKFSVRYANGATGDVYYKVNDATNWTKADLVLVSQEAGQYEASLTETLSQNDVIHFKATPGADYGIEANQGVCVQAGATRETIENGAANIVTENGISYTLANNIDYSFEFSFDRAGGPAPGGNTDGSDAAPAVDAASIQFYDRFNNNFTYEEFKRANLGTVQYSTDGGINWNEFNAKQVNLDEKLLWYTDKSDEEPANWKQIYYFKKEDAANVQLKVTQGSLCYKISNGNVTNITNNAALSNLVTSGQILSIFPQDDGVRNITWSDDAEAEDQRVENGKVIIEKAVIGEKNALITDAPYSQQGNKGYVGIKGGAAVTVKLIPDYGYQVDTLELNGQSLTPQEEEATYTFTMPNTNLHLRAIFEESSDEINTTADGVNGGQIAGGENVIDSGNLRLSVSDSNMTTEQKAKMQDSAAAKDTDILSYLEVDLEKFVNKGDSGQEWIEDLEELSEKIKITLNVGKNLDKNKTYVVVREHEGVYEQIPAIYDQDAGTLTFESDKFSDYALATIDKGGAVAGTDSAETGDNSNMAPWILIMLAAAAGLTGTVAYRKRKTQ